MQRLDALDREALQLIERGVIAPNILEGSLERGTGRPAGAMGNVATNEKAQALPELITAEALYAIETTNVRGLLTIPHTETELLHSGVTIFAAPQKIGKSWLALQIAIHLAGGRKVQGLESFENWRVLFGALEEPKSRTSSRLKKLAGPGEWQQNLSFFYALLPLMGGGAEQLNAMVGQFQPQLLILDTLSAVVKSAHNGGDVFRQQYGEITCLRQIAEKYTLSLLLIHHTRKGVGDDLISSVAGTGGITAACDSVWGLKRKPEGYAELEITGRETAETCLALKFEKDDPFGWSIIGDAAEEALAATRRGIVDLLREEPNQSPAQIARALGKKADSVRQTLKRLVQAGLVAKEQGKYHATVTHQGKCHARDDD